MKYLHIKFLGACDELSFPIKVSPISLDLSLPSSLSLKFSQGMIDPSLCFTNIVADIYVRSIDPGF